MNRAASAQSTRKRRILLSWLKRNLKKLICNSISCKISGGDIGFRWEIRDTGLHFVSHVHNGARNTYGEAHIPDLQLPNDIPKAGIKRGIRQESALAGELGGEAPGRFCQPIDQLFTRERSA